MYGGDLGGDFERLVSLEVILKLVKMDLKAIENTIHYIKIAAFLWLFTFIVESHLTCCQRIID